VAKINIVQLKKKITELISDTLPACPTSNKIQLVGLEIIK